jgi:thymidylate synthase ThyX
MYAVQILADSIGYHDHRLTTFQITIPRIILAELNTHRVLSRNAASSRAIPVEKRIEAVLQNPYIPESFGANKPGMQAGDALADQISTREDWLQARDNAVESARKLAKSGVHKQWANRLIEPFAWVDVIVSATEWDNFFNVRTHPDAQPEFQRIARMMLEAYQSHKPALIDGYHLPMVREEDQSLPLQTQIQLSVARCARVSYLTHEGKRDIDADLALYHRLLTSGHMSPFEHPAESAWPLDVSSGNFRGWLQHRKTIPREANILGK